MRLPLARMPTVAVTAALLAAPAAGAATRVTLEARRVVAGPAAATQVVASAARRADGALELRARAARVAGPGLPALAALELRCPALRATAGALDCRDARLAFDPGAAGTQQLQVALRWRDAGGRLELSVDEGRLAGGRLAARAEARGLPSARAAWTLDATFDGVELAAAAALLPVGTLPEGLTLAGRGGGRLQLTGRGATPASAALEARAAGAGFATADGSAAAENGTPVLELTATQADGAWRFSGTAGLAAGQAYVEPVFLDFGAHALRASVAGEARSDGSEIRLTRFAVEHAGVLAAEGSARLAPRSAAVLTQATLDLTRFDVATAVPAYLAPVLVGTDFQDLAGAGRVSGRLELEAGLPVLAELAFADVALDSPKGALGVAGLAGQLRWFSEPRRLALAEAEPAREFGSTLAFDSARLWNIPIGAARLEFATSGRNFRLVQPAFLPVFDGGLALDTLRVRQAGLPEMYVRLDAALRPIGIAAIGRALGWPEFGGTLAGRIPELTLEQGLVTLGGNVEARVFDGRVTVRNLRLRDPLGQFPQLFADIDVDALDLEQITSAFEFGRITGRLSGRVQGLETFAWQPLAFDARLYSTPGDRTPRRISQRAVANLSSIGGGSGGGVSAALQSGFLRFFDEFRYRRLGISCRLANDVCTVDGIGQADGGRYYIVEGSGIPRMDVVGSQRRVAWTRLLGQLKAVAVSGGVVVE